MVLDLLASENVSASGISGSDIGVSGEGGGLAVLRGGGRGLLGRCSEPPGCCPAPLGRSRLSTHRMGGRAPSRGRRPFSCLGCKDGLFACCSTLVSPRTDALASSNWIH